MDRIEDSTVCYNQVMLKIEHLAVFLITLSIKQIRTCINVDRMTRKAFSENEHFRHQLGVNVRLLCFIAKLPMLC
jgi:hypothetical protein